MASRYSGKLAAPHGQLGAGVRLLKVPFFLQKQGEVEEIGRVQNLARGRSQRSFSVRMVAKVKVQSALCLLPLGFFAVCDEGDHAVL